MSRTWLFFGVCIILLVCTPQKSSAVLIYKIERIINLHDATPLKHDSPVHLTEVNDFGFIAGDVDAIQRDTQKVYLWDDTPALVGVLNANKTGAMWNNNFPMLPTVVDPTARMIGARNAATDTIDDFVFQPPVDDMDESFLSNLSMDDSERIICSGTDLAGNRLALLLSKESDMDGNGLPDRWEMHYYGHLGVDLSEVVPCGSDVSNWEAFLLGINPIDYYQGQPPILHIVEGGTELNKQSDFKRGALTVAVTTCEGKALAHAPVDFALVLGGGNLCASADGCAISSRIRVFSDEEGDAKAWFIIAPLAPSTSTVTVNAGTTAPAEQVVFTEQTVDHPFPKSPQPPANFVEKVNPDGSRDLSWINVSDDAVCTKIRIRDQYGQWKIIGSVPANATSAHINPDGTLANKLP